MSKKNRNDELQIEISAKTLSTAAWVVGGVILFGLVAFQLFGTTSKTTQASNTPAVVVDISGKQIVEMNAGFSGYTPSVVEIKAGEPTVLRVKSSNNFGCGSAFKIPKLNISKNLPANGNVDLDLGTLTAGSTFDGMCSMGMYRIKFKVV
jgi:plastocyanin domain-containing protein